MSTNSTTATTEEAASALDNSVEIQAAKDAGVIVNGRTLQNEDEISTPVKPEYVEDKFWDAEKGEIRHEDMAKSYAELQRKMSQGEPTAAEEPSPAAPSEAPNAQQSVIDNAVQAYAKNGSLSDTDYESLASQGLSRDLVDNYIQGQMAQATAQQTELLGVVGGSQENFNKMADWARQNLSESEITGVDAALADPKVSKMVLSSLYSRYQNEANIEPTDNITNAQPVASSGDYYKSRTEMTEAMSDPRYHKDPAYRQEVLDKIKRGQKQNASVFYTRPR